MYIFSDFKVKINGSDETVEKIGKVLKQIVTDVEFEVGREIEILETCECAYAYEVSDLALEMARVASAEFEIHGYVDSSSSSGEYMDFEFLCKDGVLTEKLSDWYTQERMDDFDNYEDFCEYVYKCAEEEYNRLKKNCETVYVLETQGKEVLSETVPFTIIRTYEIQAL